MPWEYTVAICIARETWKLNVAGREHELDVGLDHLGHQGWELAGVHARSSKPERSYSYIFKRLLGWKRLGT